MIGRRWFIHIDIERRACHFAFADGIREVFLVDDAAAGAIDDTDPCLHFGKRGTIDQPLCFRRKGYVDGDTIGFREDLL